MDRMQTYELSVLVDGLPYVDRCGWEQTRAEIFTIASILSKDKLSPDDVMQFAWDNKEAAEARQSISSDDVARLKRTAQNYLRHE